MIDELQDEGLSTVDMVKDFSDDFEDGLSSSIKRWLVKDDDDDDRFETMVDESVDLGDVTESHMNVGNTLGDYVKVQRARRETERVLVAALTSDGSKLPTTSGGVRGTMKPFVNLVAFLDLACARRGHDGDEGARYGFWKRRKTSHYRPSHRDHIAIVEYCVDLLDAIAFVRVNAEGPLFPAELTLAEMSRREYCDRYIEPFRGSFGALREKTPNAWLAGKSAVKAEVRYVVEQYGFMLRPFKKSSTSYDRATLLRAMVIARCISAPDRFAHWATLFDDPTWRAIQARFEELLSV
ncbi:hypothetical protein V1505DRAFT_228949 [Lipomyces doorenjongii]